MLQNNLSLIFNIVIFLILGAFGFWLWKLQRRFDFFFRDAKVENLEQFLHEKTRHLKNFQDRLEATLVEVKRLNGIAEASFQKIGFIRFNPFKGEVGGDQSFSLALLDSKDNGFVISSIYSREGSRTYAKTVESGNSRFSLSDEEKEALAQALRRLN